MRFWFTIAGFGNSDQWVCGCGLIFLAWVVVGFILVVVGWL